MIFEWLRAVVVLTMPFNIQLAAYILFYFSLYIA